MSELTRPGCPSSRNVDGHSHDYRLHIHTGGGPIGAAVPLPEKDAEIARLRAENETLRRQAADDLSRLGQEMDRECTCTPLPDAEGPCAWCDVHGLPSVAWRQGSDEGRRNERDVANMEIRELRQRLAAFRADRDRLSEGLRVMAARLTRERRRYHDVAEALGCGWGGTHEWICEVAKRGGEANRAVVERLMRAVKVDRNSHDPRCALLAEPEPPACDCRIWKIFDEDEAKPWGNAQLSAQRLDQPTAEGFAFCEHHPDAWADFDRTVCAEPCRVMHMVCRECGAPVDPCAHDNSTTT